MAPLLPRTSIARDNISKYVRGKVLPQPLILEAMAKVLDMAPSDLLATRRTNIPAANPPLDARDLGDGNVWLRVNRAVSWDVALQVMKLLRGGA